MTEGIDLKALKEAAEKAYEEACDLRSGSTRYMDELSEFTCDPELIVRLVAVVEAARALAEGQAGNAWPEMVALRTALHPFTEST